jgi:hypothetical protein
VSYFLAPIADCRAQFFDAQGRVLNGGFLYSYAATSTTPQNTYTDSTGGTANQNPIQLNSDGRTPSGVYLTSGLSYKFVLKDSAGNTLWTQDVVAGINDTVTPPRKASGPPRASRRPTFRRRVSRSPATRPPRSTRTAA